MDMNQNYYGSMNGGYNGYYNQGYNQQQYPRASATLTNEEIKEVQRLSQPNTSIKPTVLDKLRGMCNHWKPNGSPGLRGTKSQCEICGQYVNLDVKTDDSDVIEATREFTNLQEVAKFCSYNMNEKTKREYFGNTIPFNSKLPIIFNGCKGVLNRFKESQQYTANINNPGSILLNNYMNTTGFGGNYQQPPFYPGYGMGMPAQPDPMGAFVQGQPDQNPFYYDQNQQAPQPQQQFMNQPQMMGGYNYQQPPYQQPQQQPVAPGYNYQQPAQMQQPPVMQEGVQPGFTGNYVPPKIPTVKPDSEDVKQTNV